MEFFEAVFLSLTAQFIGGIAGTMPYFLVQNLIEKIFKGYFFAAKKQAESLLGEEKFTSINFTIWTNLTIGLLHAWITSHYHNYTVIPQTTFLLLLSIKQNTDIKFITTIFGEKDNLIPNFLYFKSIRFLSYYAGLLGVLFYFYEFSLEEIRSLVIFSLATFLILTPFWVFRSGLWHFWLATKHKVEHLEKKSVMVEQPLRNACDVKSGQIKVKTNNGDVVFDVDDLRNKSRIETVNLQQIGAPLPRQNYKFTKKIIDKIDKLIYQRLKEVDNRTIDDWIDNIDRDINPLREIDVLTHIADVYERIIKKYPHDFEVRSEIYGVLLSASFGNAKRIMSEFKTKKLSLDDIGLILEEYRK